MACSIRAIWILNQHRHVVFSRRFPTVEKKWKTACSKVENESFGVCYPLPTDAQLVQAFMERKEREGSFRGLGIREESCRQGSDSWVDDPITRYIISLQLPKPHDTSSSYLLWPLILHIKGPYHILVLPLVQPHHLTAYQHLSVRNDCGASIQGDTPSLSSLLLDLPAITGGLLVAYTLGDVISGEAIEPEMSTNAVSTMGNLLDSITVGMGIASITARAKPVAAPVAAAATAIAAGVTGGNTQISSTSTSSSSSSILGASTTKGILKTSDKEALVSFITSAMPFGTPLDLNPLTINSMKQIGFWNHQIQESLPSQDQKQPGWKPYLYRGSKQRIILLVHEVITAALYDRDDVGDVVSISGQILCRCDIDGLPDITLSLSSSPTVDSLSCHSCAQTLDQQEQRSDKHTITLTFSPPLTNFILARYLATPSPSLSPPSPSPSPSLPPPVQGFYQLSMISEDEGALLFRMKIMEGYKAPMVMEHCSLTIPFQRRKIAALNGAPSFGSVSHSEHAIEWKILVAGRHVVSKSMEATFSGTVKFAPKSNSDLTTTKGDFDASDDDDDLTPAEWEDPFCWEAYSYAKVRN